MTLIFGSHVSQQVIWDLHMVTVELEQFYKKQYCKELNSLQDGADSKTICTTLNYYKKNTYFFQTSSMAVVELSYGNNCLWFVLNI